MNLLYTLSVVASVLLVACGSGSGTGESPTQPYSDFTKIKSVPVTKGSFTDPRDGKTYKTVTIGSQTWMAENLNYMPSRCYDDDPLNCELYGGLYDQSAAEKACPEGWHLPGGKYRGDEWKVLIETLDENNKPEECGSSVNGSGGIIACGEVVQGLKSSSGWATENGSDLYGFSILPAGEYSYFMKVYMNAGLKTEFWIIGPTGRSSVWVGKESEKWIVRETGAVLSDISVRCVKN
ncbi:MAG: FISUMP domain-containing protein [Fibrobacter sp.]|uniref:FISUMP domain-containing protein n=1 Tax=Fibrobacter sp. TaxID=35828 RepID=UPI002A996F9D|nr:FISUMP domain-containing protein [Fibrobacter sp.]